MHRGSVIEDLLLLFSSFCESTPGAKCVNIRSDAEKGITFQFRKDIYTVCVHSLTPESLHRTI